MKKYELIPEHEARFAEWRDYWIANAMSCEEMGARDKERARVAVLGLYAAAKLETPRHVVFALGPISGAIASGVAAGIWYIRENPGQHKELFGKKLTEAMFPDFIQAACQALCERGLKKLHGRDADATRQVVATIPVAREAAGVTGNASGKATPEPVMAFLLACAARATNLLNGGNQWSGFPAYATFFRYVAELPIDYSAWHHYEELALCSGPRFVHSRFCIVSDRPEKITGPVPHCPDGPSHVWRDGFSLYFWRGTRIPADWIDNAAQVNPSLALTWENLEQRRCLAEIIGWEKILRALKPTVVDQDPDPEIGTLLRVDLPDAPGEQFIRVQCGTGRTFALPVPPNMKTALEANAWTYGLEGDILKKNEFRA